MIYDLGRIKPLSELAALLKSLDQLDWLDFY